MFIILLTYIAPIEKIEKELNNHIIYLKEQYSLGYFIASGRKVPRTGGIIISNIKDINQLNQILEKDTFKRNKLVEYNITEFIPTITSEELNFLL